ncbi:hypothetical protein ACOMHN_023594 [Nucella lapillus]
MAQRKSVGVTLGRWAFYFCLDDHTQKQRETIHAQKLEKCSGRWAIHACWGGNGKRSDPSVDLAPSPTVLRQLLLRNRPVFPSAMDSSEEDQSADEADPSSFNSDISEYNVPPPFPSVSRLAALLKTLRTLQRENDALP